MKIFSPHKSRNFIFIYRLLRVAILYTYKYNVSIHNKQWQSLNKRRFLNAQNVRSLFREIIIPKSIFHSNNILYFVKTKANNFKKIRFCFIFFLYKQIVVKIYKKCYYTSVRLNHP